jgi:hypothetical protein
VCVCAPSFALCVCVVCVCVCVQQPAAALSSSPEHVEKQVQTSILAELQRTQARTEPHAVVV